MRLDLLVDGAGVTVTAMRLFNSRSEAEAEAARLSGVSTGQQSYVVQPVRTSEGPGPSGPGESHERRGGAQELADLPFSFERDELERVRTTDLLSLYGRTSVELARRGALEPFAPPGAQWAESLVARYFGVVAIPDRGKRVSGYDFTTSDNRKVEVKSLISRPNKKSPTVQLPQVNFDVLVVVVLTTHFSIESAFVVPVDVLAGRAVASGGGMRLKLTDALLAHPEVQEISSELSAIAAAS